MNLQFLTNITPKKVKITFRHAITNELLGIEKRRFDNLPESFTKPMTIKWEETEWRVLKAEPKLAKDYTLDNKLTLYVQENALLDTNKIGYDLATICSDMPELSERPLYDDFFMDITKERWRQLELLPAALLPEVQEEITKIGMILSPGDHINTLMGYDEQYLRKNMTWQSYPFSVDKFLQNINVLERGTVLLADYGFIQNGFAFRTADYTYYGKLNGNNIETLCLQAFECMDEEFFQLASECDLMLADWCNGKIVMP